MKVLQVLQGTEKSFNAAVALMAEGKAKLALESFFELITTLDTYLAPPYRDYHLCQEYVRRCMLSLGSVHVSGSLPLA